MYCGGRFIIPLLRFGDIKLELVGFGFGLGDRFNVGGFGGFSLGIGLRFSALGTPPPDGISSLVSTSCLMCSGLWSCSPFISVSLSEQPSESSNWDFHRECNVIPPPPPWVIAAEMLSSSIMA